MFQIYSILFCFIMPLSYQQITKKSEMQQMSNLILTTVTRNDLIYRVSSENEIEDYTTNIEANKYIMFSLIVLLLIGPLMMIIWCIKFVRNLCKNKKRKHNKKREYYSSLSRDSRNSWSSSSLTSINTEQANDCNCMIKISNHKRKRANKSYHQLNKKSKNALRKAKSFENLIKIFKTKSLILNNEANCVGLNNNLKSKVLFFSANHLNLINVKQFLTANNLKQHEKESQSIYNLSLNTLSNYVKENFDDYNENYSGSIRNIDLNLFDKILTHETRI
jgi:hypothetical protein